MNDSQGTGTAVRPVGMVLIFAAQRVETRYESALGEVGLSLPKLGVLKHLVEAGEPIPLSRLADKMACVKSNITQLVDRLETEGLVERIGDSVDRRCVRASITALGRDRFERGATIMTDVETELFGATTDEDRAHVLAFLSALGSPCSGA